jgi:hypothetical protein
MSRTLAFSRRAESPRLGRWRIMSAGFAALRFDACGPQVGFDPVRRVGDRCGHGSTGVLRALGDVTDRRAAADPFERAVAGSCAEPRDDRPAARSGARTRSTDDPRRRPAVSDGIANQIPGLLDSRQRASRTGPTAGHARQGAASTRQVLGALPLRGQKEQRPARSRAAIA